MSWADDCARLTHAVHADRALHALTRMLRHLQAGDFWAAQQAQQIIDEPLNWGD